MGYRLREVWVKRGSTVFDIDFHIPQINAFLLE